MAEGKTARKPWPLYRWDLAREMGWTLDYVDNLPLRDLIQRKDIERGKAMYKDKLSREDNEV